MNWADYSILSIVGVSVAISVWRGFTREALSLVGWILAFWVAIGFSANLEGMLRSHIEVPSLRLSAAFVILFLLTLLLMGLVNFLAAQLIEKTGLSGTDRMVGVFFGVARGGVVVLALVLLAGFTALPGDPWWDESTFIHYFQDTAEWSRQFLPAELAEKVRY